jgi:hypothetical protein
MSRALPFVRLLVLDCGCSFLTSGRHVRSNHFRRIGAKYKGYVKSTGIRYNSLPQANFAALKDL